MSIPDMDSFPADAKWETPYVWNTETNEWERIPKLVSGTIMVDGEAVSFDSEESYLAASQVPELRT